MSNNRECLAKEITKRFISAISGSDQEQWVNRSPEDRIFVGKLSPRSSSDSFSSNVSIKQISVDFYISKDEINHASIEIFPQGNFFYRVIPTLLQQRDGFVKEFSQLFRTDKPFSSFEDMVAFLKSPEASQEMRSFKVSLLPIYEKIAIDRNNFSVELKLKDIYDSQYDCGSISEDSKFYEKIHANIDELCDEISHTRNVMPCQMRDKVSIGDLENEDSWEKYLSKQVSREEFSMLPRFEYSISVDLHGTAENIRVRVSLSNETMFGDETSGYGQESAKNDKYRINTLFNSGIKIISKNASFVPIQMDYFADDYKYDKRVYAIGSNCNVDWDLETMTAQTTHIPCYYQYRLKTNNTRAVKFDELINNPVETLERTYRQMLAELNTWQNDYEARKSSLTTQGQKQFENEINQFRFEIQRFHTGVSLIKQYNMVGKAFSLMNQSFARSAKGYDSWRLFQIVFIVSLILDVVANEPDLLLDEEIKEKAKTDLVDILYFPTGGGKTEAFLGIMVFNLFFDRLRGKDCGVTALLKYPLRLLSVQQVQRVSNILATAEIIRRENDIEGKEFSLGYFVGKDNTPNNLRDKHDRENLELLPTQDLDERFKLLDICPFCGQPSIHVFYDNQKNSLAHICENPACLSHGRIPLYMVDDDIYQALPSVIISTVDKMTAIGLNSRFRNLLMGAEYECPVHGFTNGKKCLSDGCTCDPLDFKHVHMKDPAPTLLIQDELHLIKESLGAYDAHYETLIEYFVKSLSGCRRGIKVIGATATISAYETQARHLYWKNAIRFPSESPYLDHNFYSYIDPNDLGRIIIGYAPFGKAIVNSVAYSLQYLKRVVWNLFIHPEEIARIPGMNLEGTEEEQKEKALKLLEEYWIILEYNNVKMESNRVLQAIDSPINPELRDEGIEPLEAKKMTGDDSFQEVRSTLSTIEHAESVIHDMDFNMIAATSMISHGVDADRFNLMLFYGIPGNTAEYIQAYSRVGRKHTGVVIDIMRPSREKDQSFLRHFVKYHEYKDILVDSVSINRWASKAVDCTLPGILSGIILNYYMPIFLKSDHPVDLSKFAGIKDALSNNLITPDELKQHAYGVYKCSDDDSSIGKLYKKTIDESVDKLVEKITSSSFDSKMYITQAFEKAGFYVMASLRDTDKQLLVEMK